MRHRAKNRALKRVALDLIEAVIPVERRNVRVATVRQPKPAVMLGFKVVHDRKVANHSGNAIAAREQLFRHQSAKAAAHAGDEPKFRSIASWESEALAHHLLALGPERLGVLRIECVRPHALADGGDQAFGDRRHMAVLAIAAAHILGWGDERGPD